MPDDRTTVNCMYCGITIVVREAIQAAAVGNVKNWLQIARTATQSGNYQEGYAFFTRILEVEGENSEAWLGRAEAAGRMSTVQNFRLLEMLTGIEKVLESPIPGQRRDLELRSSRLICSITSIYYHSMKAQITPHLKDPASWTEYINQIHKVIQVLERAHLALPKSEEIIDLIIQVSRDNLQRSGIAYKNSVTGQTNYLQLPQNQKLWLQGRSDYYTGELLTLNPQATLLPVSRPGLLEQLPKLSAPVWIAIGVLGFIMLAMFSAIVDGTQRSKEKGSTAEIRQTDRTGVTVDSRNNEFVSAGSRLWTGVRLYHGQSKTYVGEVLGGNEQYVDPITGRTFRGLKVRTPTGAEEWKDRNAVVFGEWYVRRDDPAIARAEWFEYQQ